MIRRLDMHGPVEWPGTRAMEATVTMARALPALAALSLRNLSLFAGRGEDPRGRFGPFWRELFSRVEPGGIVWLELRGLPLDPPAVEELVSSRIAPRLVHLRMAACRIGAEGALALARWPAHCALETLDVGVDQVDTRAFEAWSTSPLLAKLRKLSCGANLIDSAALEALASGPGELRIEAIDLAECGVYLVSVGRLVSSPRLPHLHDLRVRGCLLGDEAADLLLAEPFRSRCRALDLSNDDLTDDFVRAVTSRPPPPRLVRLRVDDNSFSPEGVALLQEWAAARPGLETSLWTAPPDLFDEPGTTELTRSGSADQ